MFNLPIASRRSLRASLEGVNDVVSRAEFLSREDEGAGPPFNVPRLHAVAAIASNTREYVDILERSFTVIFSS